jgi:hypothetical protein
MYLSDRYLPWHGMWCKSRRLCVGFQALHVDHGLHFAVLEVPELHTHPKPAKRLSACTAHMRAPARHALVPCSISGGPLLLGGTHA